MTPAGVATHVAERVSSLADGATRLARAATPVAESMTRLVDGALTTDSAGARTVSAPGSVIQGKEPNMRLSTIARLPNCNNVSAAARDLGQTTLLTMFVLVGSAATGGCSSSSTGGTVAPATGTDSGAPATGVDAGPSGTGADGATPVPAVAFFRGTLARTVTASQAYSDPFFEGVKAEATGAGDNGHDALLGTTDLGTTLDQFVGLDTWSSDANMDAVYSNPMVLAFGMSFYAAPPEFKTFYLTNFYQWGNTDSGDVSTPHYFVMIRGRYNDTPDKIKSLHDPIEQGIQARSSAAGQVAHIVYSGREDSHDALMVDIWTTNTNIDTFYSDAGFKSSLDSLFDTTGPNLGVYGSTDWVTW
jgi:hypothetical protein